MSHPVALHRRPLRESLQFLKLLLLLVPAVATAWALQDTGLLAAVKLTHWKMLGGLLAGCLLAQGLAWLLWRRRMGLRALALGAGVYWAVQLNYYVGPGEVLVAVVVAAGALAVGSLVLGKGRYDLLDRLLPGAALIVAVVGWTLPFPIHGSRVYVVAFAFLILLARRQLLDDGRQLGRALSTLAAEHPLLLAMLVTVVGFASMGLWLPSLNFDDNSSHLAIQSQLLRDGYYRFDIASQVWALAPWFNNTWHGIAAVLLGAESRAAVNLIWLLLGVSGAYRLCIALGAGSRAGLLAAAVFASHPLTAYYGTTLQVDGPSAAILLHLAAVLCGTDLTRRSTWIPGALIGITLALKMTNVVFVVLPCLYVTWVALRDRRLGWWLRVALISALIGGSSYLYAAALTGNPTFPMFNTVFQSPYYPLEGFSDPRWHVGIGPWLLWDLTFETSSFMEAYPGAAGVSLLVLLGGTLAVLLRAGPSRWLALAALLPAAVLFIEVQYLRYVFPSMAILGVLSVAALDQLLARWSGVLVTTLALVCVTNLGLMANTSWIMRSGAWEGLASEGRSNAVALESRVTPHRALLERMISRYPDACILNVDRRPYTARLMGRAVSVAWYDPQMARAVLWAGKDAQGSRWGELVGALGVSHVLVPKQGEPVLEAALTRLGARREDQEQDLVLWRLTTESGQEAKCDPRFFEARDTAHHRLHAFDSQP